MIELPRALPNLTQTRLKVLGIGTAGCNMLDRLVLDGLPGAELISLNTDAQSLAGCVAPQQVQMGLGVTRGLGTGGDPELGRQAAEESAEAIRNAVSGATMVFLLAGLGGGTSSGTLPAIAQAARAEGAQVVVAATLPFGFEGRRRMEQAEECLAELRQCAELIVCFENDRMAELVAAKTGVREAFAAVDITMSQCVRALGTLAQRRGVLHAGFDEIAALFQDTDLRALFGTAWASGDNRAHEAAEAVLRSPLLDQGRQLKEMTRAAIHISGGADLTLHEVETLMTEMRRHLPEEADLFCGLAVDEAMAGRLEVTIIGAVTRTGAMVVPAPARREVAVVAPPVEEDEAMEPMAEQTGEEEPAAELEPEAAPEPETVRPRMRPLFAPMENVRRTTAPEVGAKPREVRQEQMQFEPVNRGRFEKSEPTIVDGQDLDVPTFLRRNLRTGKQSDQAR